jgi:flagellar basal-body rod protein FlgB
VAEVQGKVVASPSDNVGGDLNTVSLDQEMGRFTANTFHYNTSVEFLSRYMDKLRRTIGEGGR